MESVLLDTPDGISARLGWDPKVTEHDRKRILAKELLSAYLKVETKDLIVEREAPAQFGFHTQLFGHVRGEQDEIPLAIRTASFRAATVVAIADPAVPLGLDIRDAHPDDATLHEMRRHSHIFDEENVQALIAHWTRVQAIREADGRGGRVAGEHVRLDTSLTKGWIPDRHVKYRLADLSRDGWIVTLAYGALPV